MPGFTIHKDFENKKFFTDLSLSTVLINPIEEFHWFVLVPRVVGAKNLLSLSEEQKVLFFQDINLISEFVNFKYKPDQINIAMLGNKTPQLHCHVIARFKDDISWPNSPFDLLSLNYNIDLNILNIKHEFETFLKSYNEKKS